MNYKLTVVSPAYFPNMELCSMLIDSCKNYKINLHLFGQGEPWPGLFYGKVCQLRAEIEQLHTDYVMVCDSSDAFLLSGENCILTKFIGMGAPVVFSAEKNCWPQPSIASYFPRIVSPWCFLNSGGYLGRKKDIVNLLNYVEAMVPNEAIYRTRDWDTDQFRFALVYIDSQSSIKLDTRCEIFQTMANVKANEVSWQGGYFRNVTNNTFPSVIHYNGHAPGSKATFTWLKKHTYPPVEAV